MESVAADLTLEGKRGGRGSRRSSLTAATLHVPMGWLGSADALLAVGILALAAGLVVYLPSGFGVDSWLALAAGRAVWLGGLPHHETLTTVARGAPWVDQQWLSQLASYGLDRIGGLGLLGIVNVALLISGIGGAVVSARRLGASPRTMMLLLPLCVWTIVPAREVRTQEFAIPLFVATVYLLARDVRRPSHRVYWCLPVLILWANLHGTASLGAGLVALRGLTLGWERRHMPGGRELRQLVRPVALSLGGPLSLLVTPYGFQIVSYYRATLFNPALRHAVTEWQPVTFSALIAIPFFVLAAIALWAFGRSGRRTPLWDRLVLIALVALSVEVIRNVTFFALCALALVPVALDAGAGCRRADGSLRRVRTNAVLAAMAALAVVVAGIAALEKPAARFEAASQRLGVLSAVQEAVGADPSIRVMADTRFSDWLLWRDPDLTGHLAIDARYEILPQQQIGRLERLFEAVGPTWKRAARGYRLLVLAVRADRDAVEGFLSEPGRRILYDDGQRIVILRSETAALGSQPIS